MLGAALMLKRLRLTIPKVKAGFQRVRRPTRPTAGPIHRTSPTQPSVPDLHRPPLGTKDIALTGPGAEDAVRHLALQALADQRNDTVEVLIDRSDAWRLFGIDLGALREERIPGLTLADDPQQRDAHLSRPRPLRRLLITCNDRPEDVRRLLLSHQPGQLTIVSLAPRTEPSVEVCADGEIVRNPTTTHKPKRLPTLLRQDAFESLMRLPTLATQPVNRDRSDGTRKPSIIDGEG